jgi:hypothetical protein
MAAPLLSLAEPSLGRVGRRFRRSQCPTIDESHRAQPSANSQRFQQVSSIHILNFLKPPG